MGVADDEQKVGEKRGATKRSRDWDKKKRGGRKERRRRNEEGRGRELVEKGDLAKKEWDINQKKRGVREKGWESGKRGGLSNKTRKGVETPEKRRKQERRGWKVIAKGEEAMREGYR